MKLEKTTLFSSLAIVGGFVLRELVKARIKVKTMAIPMGTLQAFVNDNTFVALYFNPFYDNRTLAKDVVSLVAYKETTDKHQKPMQKVTLETAGEDKLFGNEKDYSAYKLHKEDIKIIVDRFNDNSAVQYILFVPELYIEDENYFSYKIIPADALKKPLTLAGRVAFQKQSVTASVEGSDGDEEAVSTQMFAMTSERLGVMYMNPSPPASSSFALS